MFIAFGSHLIATAPSVLHPVQLVHRILAVGMNARRGEEEVRMLPRHLEHVVVRRVELALLRNGLAALVVDLLEGEEEAVGRPSVSSALDSISTWR